MRINRVIFSALITVSILASCTSIDSNLTPDLGTPGPNISATAPGENPATATEPDSTKTPDQTREIIGAEREAGMAKGDEIILLIEQYKQDTGQYPETLADLIPEYLDTVPVTAAGMPFDYMQTPDIYYLGFDLASKINSYCSYIRRLNLWECGYYAGP